MLNFSRSLATSTLSVVNNVARQQFTVAVPGAVAHLDYNLSGKNITFITTDVPQEFQGQGVGKMLAKNALDYAWQNKLNVMCQCHFIAKFYQDNKDKYQGLKIDFDL